MSNKLTHIWEHLTKDCQCCKRCKLLKIKGYKKVPLRNGSKINVIEYNYYNKLGVKGFTECFNPQQLKLNL